MAVGPPPVTDPPTPIFFDPVLAGTTAASEWVRRKVGYLEYSDHPFAVLSVMAPHASFDVTTARYLLARRPRLRYYVVNEDATYEGLGVEAGTRDLSGVISVIREPYRHWNGKLPASKDGSDPPSSFDLVFCGLYGAVGSLPSRKHEIRWLSLLQEQLSLRGAMVALRWGNEGVHDLRARLMQVVRSGGAEDDQAEEARELSGIELIEAVHNNLTSQDASAAPTSSSSSSSPAPPPSSTTTTKPSPSPTPPEAPPTTTKSSPSPPSSSSSSSSSSSATSSASSLSPGRRPGFALLHGWVELVHAQVDVTAATGEELRPEGAQLVRDLLGVDPGVMLERYPVAIEHAVDEMVDTSLEGDGFDGARVVVWSPLHAVVFHKGKAPQPHEHARKCDFRVPIPLDDDLDPRDPIDGESVERRSERRSRSPSPVSTGVATDDIRSPDDAIVPSSHPPHEPLRPTARTALEAFAPEPWALVTNESDPAALARRASGSSVRSGSSLGRDGRGGGGGETAVSPLAAAAASVALVPRPEWHGRGTWGSLSGRGAGVVVRGFTREANRTYRQDLADRARSLLPAGSALLSASVGPAAGATFPSLPEPQQLAAIELLLPHDPWYPQGRDHGFFNLGRHYWTEMRHAWTAPPPDFVPPRPPPPVDLEVVIEELAAVQRTCTLPGPMRLGDIIDIYQELWERESFG